MSECSEWKARSFWKNQIDNRNMNGTRSLPKHNHFNVSLESILPLYEESVRIDYVESVFNWKGAAQRSRFAYIPWAINLKKGPGAAPLKWTPGPIVEFGGNDSPKISDQI